MGQTQERKTIAVQDEKQLLYRIWLNACCDHEPMQVRRLLDTIGTPEEIYRADLFRSPYAGKLKLGQRIRLSTKLDGAKRILEQCEKSGIRVLSIDDPDYPACLKEVYAPPQILYVFGEMPDFNQMLGVAVVGTRRGTGEGERFAGILGHDLAANGVLVISGMAKGMDAAAHWGALEAGGNTVAVLAGGVDVIYPKENAELYTHIKTHGCIVSERPPGQVGKPYYYRQRNRIIVGLSVGVAVVEGERESGTSMTARLAQENNRDIFAVPGNPLNPMSHLPNDLIADGCKPLTDAMDIVEEYLSLYPEKLAYGAEQKKRPVIGSMKKKKKPVSRAKPGENKKQTPPKEKALSAEDLEQWMNAHSIQEEEKDILRFLFQKGGMAEYDEIADFCQIDSGILSSMLIILQMKKAVIPHAGGQYQLGITGYTGNSARMPNG